ncbi:MAG: PASTA domain-containing protein [Bacteroidales bacterium]|nr:PASTA domain-containing protein [Bacteroidales bacterium]
MDISKKISPALKKIVNHYIVKNLLIFFIICFFVYAGSFVILRYYTHHGEALSVPDLRGMTLKEAEVLLTARKLRGKLSDSVYVASARPGSIVSQNPEPNFKVKKNRNVFLVINAVTPEMTYMPGVVGVSLRQATSILETQGLTVGKLTYVPDLAKNNVLKQRYNGREIRAKTKIAKGSSIDLELGRGLSDERTHVPNLTGLYLSEARNILTKYFLNIGVMIYDSSVATSADSLRAFIWRQKPAGAGYTLQLGDQVDVWLTVDENKKSDGTNKE